MLLVSSLSFEANPYESICSWKQMQPLHSGSNNLQTSFASHTTLPDKKALVSFMKTVAFNNGRAPARPRVHGFCVTLSILQFLICQCLLVSVSLCPPYSFFVRLFFLLPFLFFTGLQLLTLSAQRCRPPTRLQSESLLCFSGACVPNMFRPTGRAEIVPLY